MDPNEEDRTGREGESEDRPQSMRLPADTGSTGLRSSSEILKRFGVPTQQVVTGPVPFEVHYDIFKQVEDRLHDHLAGLPREYFLGGLRVAYDLLDSPSEPNVLPYSVEFGYMGPGDAALECDDQEKEVTQEELQELFQNSPIPLDLLNQLFVSTRDELQKSSNEALRTGVFIVLHGSPFGFWAAWCGCSNNRVKYCFYNNRGKRIFCGVCTNTACNTVL